MKVLDGLGLGGGAGDGVARWIGRRTIPTLAIRRSGIGLEAATLLAVHV